MILAPALTLVVLLLLIVLCRLRVGYWRMACLNAAVIVGIFVVASTELLSLWYVLTRESLLVVWGAVAGALGVVAWYRRIEIRHLALCVSCPLSWVDRSLLAAVLVIVATLALVSLLAPPNTWDSMSYHMSRVAHWIQNGSVAHYLTSIQRQLHAPPLAEFAIAHLQILSGGDRFANLVQWASMVGSLVGASLIAHLLGGSRRAQLLAVVVASTIPMGILQASSTQNDYVAAFWLVCVAVFVMSGVHPALLGSALGLALLTKATSYLFAGPLVAWFLLSHVAREHRKAWRGLSIVVLIVLAINAGYYARNVVTYGAPLGPAAEGPYRYINGDFGVRTTLSVALRNLAVHLGTPWPDVNALTDRVTRAAHMLLGWDVNDPETTWFATTFRVYQPYPHEDHAPNGVHLIIVVVAIGIALIERIPTRRYYALALVAGFLLFSGVLRWQPWHSRLELPLFVLAAPLVGAVFGRFLNIGAVVAIGLSALAVWPLVANSTRPLVGDASILWQHRQRQYFSARPDVRTPYFTTAELIVERGCADVALIFAGDEYEYALWQLLKTPTSGIHIGALGSIQRPCALVSTWPELPPPLYTSSGVLYQLEYWMPPLALYMPPPGGWSSSSPMLRGRIPPH